MKKENKGHVISSVAPGSIGEELELQPGDAVVSINGQEIKDIFDYRFLCDDEELVLGVISKETGEFWEFEIEKDENEDLGLEFESGMMDEYHSCRNKCIFCFIDQLPKGMRDTLYFKDDDARLSFLQGNYVTLTNMSDEDAERICYYKLSPINISIHTTNPELRCRMLNNRFAGSALRHIKTFCDAGLELNGQVVLCKGFNDGEELERTMSDIEQYLPNFQSMSIVPVGLTKFREGLQHLDPFTKEDAEKVLQQIEAKQKYYLEKYGTRLIYASDEWYLRAERPIPSIEEYEGFPQIENGVGMLRSMIDEVEEEIQTLKDMISGNNYDVEVCYVNDESDGYDETDEYDDEDYPDDGYDEDYPEDFEEDIDSDHDEDIDNAEEFEEDEDEVEVYNDIEDTKKHDRKVSAEFLTDTVFHVVTGYAAYSTIKMLSERVAEEFGVKHIHVHRIINDFFGHDIDVTGLLTGQDILAQLKAAFKNEPEEETSLDSYILLPCSTLKSGEDIFLDDMPLEKLENALQKKVRIVKSSGSAFVGSFMKDYERDYYSNELNKYEID
ncbi:MAG: DUF512 domain-containing protein [Lachnospiraceae bacterium]|nr:DUF512 domain-containing protein [Lachnospiraceae bacterium]